MGLRSQNCASHVCKMVLTLRQGKITESEDARRFFERTFGKGTVTSRGMDSVRPCLYNHSMNMNTSHLSALDAEAYESNRPDVNIPAGWDECGPLPKVRELRYLCLDPFCPHSDVPHSHIARSYA